MTLRGRLYEITYVFLVIIYDKSFRNCAQLEKNPLKNEFYYNGMVRPRREWHFTFTIRVQLLDYKSHYIVYSKGQPKSMSTCFPANSDNMQRPILWPKFLLVIIRIWTRHDSMGIIMQYTWPCIHILLTETLLDRASAEQPTTLIPSGLRRWCRVSLPPHSPTLGADRQTIDLVRHCRPCWGCRKLVSDSSCYWSLRAALEVVGHFSRYQLV